MSFRLHHNATWRNPFINRQGPLDFLENAENDEIATESARRVKQLCRDAVKRGDRTTLDEIQKHESGLDQFIDACRRRIENG